MSRRMHDEGPSDVSEVIRMNDYSEAESQQSYVKKSIFKRFHFPQIIILGYGSLGAIYGDIGTSPLYVLNTIFADEISPSKQDVNGAISCIFWVFTLIVIVKYAFLVLQYGPNVGEGGQVALYCKISRVLKTGPTGVRLPGEKEENDLFLLTRSETIDSTQTRNTLFSQRNSKLLENPTFKKVFRRVNMVLCFIGGSLVISDGLLTPTTSVLSAIEGISIAVPSFTTKVMPVAVCILLLLFAIQPIGPQIMSIFFSPVILIWFFTIAVVGIINISDHPAVFRALNPKDAIDLLTRRKGIDVLGSVILSVTGCEAMFADVGHFSPSAVQITLTIFVYPALMLNYLGQGAYLYNHPEDVSDVFYLSIPGGVGGSLYWYVFVVATFSTIIASQALILGVFSILRQMILIDCFPHFNIIHKSANHEGKIYLPAINFALMICVICTCIGFKHSSNVTAAYGLGVSIDFLLTTVFMSLCFFIFYKVHWMVVLVFFLVFGSLEMTLVIANLKKVPHGAWFTLMVSSIMFCFFATWRYCRELKIKQEYNDRVKLKDLLIRPDTEYDSVGGPVLKLGKQRTQKKPPPETYSIKNKINGKMLPLYRYNGLAIMYTSVTALQNSASTVPKLFEVLCHSFPHLPEIFVFLCVRTAPVPHVSEEERVLIQSVKNYPGFYRCIVRAGFMDSSQISESLLNEIYSQLREINCQVFDRVILENGDVYVIHLFGREILKGKRIELKALKLGEWKLQTRIFCRMACFFHSIIIERFFQPLNDLRTISTNIVPDKQKKKTILIGREIEI